MMISKHYIAPDNYGGTGLFAGDDIPQGAIIWQRSAIDITYTAEQISRMNSAQLTYLNTYGYNVSLNDNELILEVNGDDARYMNHSDNPNVITTDNEEEADFCFAARFIKAGEELTCNYYELDPKLEYSARFLRDRLKNNS